MSIPLNFVFEDDLSEFVMTKLVSSFGHKFFFGNLYNGGGFGYIKKNINGFNEAAIATAFFVLTDLDKVPCPTNLINGWLSSSKNSNLIFRIAVREVEAWILADIEGLSQFLGVSAANFPDNPDELDDPKARLIQLAKRSRKRDIRDDIVPLNSNAKIGPNYNGRLMDFVFGEWDIERAKGRSKSLIRAYDSLDKFVYHSPGSKK